MDGVPARLPTVEALTAPSTLSTLLGAEVASVGMLGAAGLGYSYTGNRLERVEARLAGGGVRRLVLKRNRPAENWIARRTGDSVGRESRVLADPALAPIWELYDCPYLAYAVAGGEVGLLMTDLADGLLPDRDEPLADDEEARLVDALARLHARFWDGRADAVAGAVRPVERFGLFHPARLDETAPVFELARRGWPAALARLPARLVALLSEPPERLAEAAAGLPSTLLHGDCKVANFALLGDGRIAAFDWEAFCAGPAPLELGYYLAVNAGRLVEGKERLLARYRAALERALGRPIEPDLWRRVEALTVLAGANLLLWQKALPLLEPDPPGRARDEFEWWAAALARHW
jgi:hypothetical protein